MDDLEDDLEKEKEEESRDNEHTDSKEEIEEDKETDDRGDEIEQLRIEFQSGLDSLRSEISGLITGIISELTELRSKLDSISERGPGPGPGPDERPRPKGFWWKSIIEEI